MEPRRFKRVKKTPPPDNQFQQSLSAIYQNQDGSLPEISHLDVSRRNRIPVIAGMLLVVVALAVIVWVAFKVLVTPTDVQTRQALAMQFEPQKQLASGDSVTYTLRYRNQEPVPLNDLEIIFRYPDSFTFVSSEPQANNEFNTSWRVGTLEPGEEKTIAITGTVVGDVGSTQTVYATASYIPQNFSSTFKQQAIIDSQITSSIVEITVSGPTQLLPEKKATFTLRYRNTADRDLQNIKIVATYPAGFVFQESTPKPVNQPDAARQFNNEWMIDSLNKLGEGQIEISGGFLAQEQTRDEAIKASIGFVDQASGEFSVQHQQETVVTIINPGLDIDLIMNASTQGQPISFDQTLTYTIAYKNIGSYDLDDVTIKLSLESDVLDWESLEDKNDGVVDGSTITWTKEQFAALDLVRPLDTGTIDIAIHVVGAKDVDMSSAKLQTTAKAIGSLVTIGDLSAVDINVESNEIVNNVATDVEFKTEGRYFDDDNIPVGSGPLPPVVGQETTFRLYWALANSLHDLRNVSVSTKLPAGVEWSDKFLVGVGAVSYSSRDRMVTWTIDSVPPNKTYADIYAWFDVSVVPTKNQVRKLLIIADQSVFTATDQQTNNLISKTGKAITSNLEDDPIGGGKGLVVDITE